MSIKQHVVNHLLTFSLQNGDVKSVEEALARLSFLAQNQKLWSQKMFLEIGKQAVHLRDIKTEEELESYSFKNIYRCDAINTEKHFPSMLLLVCQVADQTKPDILFFNCDTVQAEQVSEDITHAVSSSSTRGRKPPSDFSVSQGNGEMLDPQEIPIHPIAHAPNPPPVNPPPYPGLRANGLNSAPDISFLRAEREVEILNHCFDDIESFMAKLQQTAEAALVLNQKKKKKKKSKKQNAEDDLLAAKAQPPPEGEFTSIFQKFKYCFCLLARLKSTIVSPSSEELVHHVFKPLDMMVKTTGGPDMGAAVSSPAMTSSAISLLQGCLNEEENLLWTSLGSNWTHSCSQLREPVAPYIPVFASGWKPEAARADGQVWEDPVESQHKHEALQRQPRLSQRSSDRHDEEMVALPPDAERLYSCSYDFIARNNSELSVQQGETLEVIESSKRWWKCRNRFNQVGFVPFNILEPVSHIESPVVSKPPPAPGPPPAPTLPKTLLGAPSGTPAASPSLQRPRTLPSYNQAVQGPDETDKVMQVNDELLQKLTNGKANLNKPLVIPRSAETTVPLDYHSPPEEVERWLSGKGFSEPTVKCLGVLTGAQLFSLNKEELRAVIPDEGARVYSQLTVQKALLEDARRTTELEAVMEKQKMKVDLKLESSTL